MGREAYLFSLKNGEEDYKNVYNSLISLGYSVVDTNAMGIFLERELFCGFIEVNITGKGLDGRCFVRIAKLNSEDTILTLLKDINEIKRNNYSLSLYDVESRQEVDLIDAQKLKERFSYAKMEFIKNFPSIRKEPIRCKEVFSKPWI